MTSLRLSTLTLTLATLVTATPAAAYELGYPAGSALPYAWATDTVTVNVNPSDWASSTRRAAIEEAADAIFANPTSYAILVQADDDSSTGPGNGENELAFTSNSALLCGPGCTWVWVDGGAIAQADVYIRNDTYSVADAKVDDTSYAGSHRSLQTMLIHELGHVAGLEHEDGNYSVMGTDWNVLHADLDSVFPYLDADAAAGLSALYTPWESFADLSVSHWGYSGHTGAYSTHERNIVRDTDDVAPWSTKVNGEPYYLLDAGETFRFETTLENKSPTAQTVDIVIVASSDAVITTADTELARFESWRLSSGVLEVMLPATLPAELDGHYYIGAIIDASGDVAEWDETNNGQYLVESYIW